MTTSGMKKSEMLSEATFEVTWEVICKATSEATSEAKSEATSEAKPEATSKAKPEATSKSNEFNRSRLATVWSGPDRSLFWRLLKRLDCTVQSFVGLDWTVPKDRTVRR